MKYLTSEEYRKFFRDDADIIEEMNDGYECFTFLKMKGTSITYMMDSERYPPTIIGMASNIDEAREWYKKHHRKPIVKF